MSSVGRTEAREPGVYDSLEDGMGESFGRQHGFGSGPVRRRSKEVQLARDIFCKATMAEYRCQEELDRVVFVLSS